MPLQTGQVLNNRYRIVKMLGEGGFGAVYRAWDITFGIPCALKENREITHQAQRQFQREAKILHTLRHPNLPLVKDYFSVPEQGQYLVMDYVDGEDLHQLLEQNGGPFPDGLVVSWLDEICGALEYLHSQHPPVIHRDIKPANIKITPDGRAMLVDFGLFKFYDPDLPTTLGARAVTPGYAPFEQYGQAPTDERTDIYAIGATAYTLLTAKVPTESILRVTGTELMLLHIENPEISQRLENVVLRAMMVMPDDRYPNVSAFRQALIDSQDILIQKSEPMIETKIAAVSATLSAPARSPDLPIQESSVIEQRTQDVGIPTTDTMASSLPKRRSVIFWVTLAVVGLAIIVLGIYALLQLAPREQEKPLPVDEPRGAVVEWSGGIEMMEWQPAREAKLFLESEPESKHFFGEMIIFHPDGDPEHRGVEGDVELPAGDIRFVDSVGWFYWGWFEGDIFAGELSLDCMHCDVHGGYEFHRK